MLTVCSINAVTLGSEYLFHETGFIMRCDPPMIAKGIVPSLGYGKSNVPAGEAMAAQLRPGVPLLMSAA